MLVKDLIAALKKLPKEADVQVLREVEHAYSINTEYVSDFDFAQYEIDDTILIRLVKP